MKYAVCEVSLPPAPPQALEQRERLVTVDGSLEDRMFSVSIEASGPIVFRAALDASVTVSVREVLSDGRQSAPCSISFVPNDAIVATSAEPSGFAIRVVSVKDADADAAPVQEPVAVEQPPVIQPPATTV